jgi:hypothetical protein
LRGQDVDRGGNVKQIAHKPSREIVTDAETGENLSTSRPNLTGASRRAEAARETNFPTFHQTKTGVPRRRNRTADAWWRDGATGCGSC